MTPSDDRQPPRWWARVARVFLEGEGGEHLRGDLDEAHRRRLDRGTSADEAHAAYRRDLIRSIVRWWQPRAVARRHGSGAPLVDTLSAASRSVVRRRGFAALVIATLGLGIGATTTIYSVVDGILLRPLPYPGADRLVELGNTFPGREWSEEAPDLLHLAGVSLPNLLYVRERVRSLDAVTGVEVVSGLVPDRERGPELVVMARATEGFLELLGASPVLGRGLLPEDYRPGAPPTVLLAYRTWVDRYGADPGVVGRTFTTGATSYTVVGVLDPAFRLPGAFPTDPVEFWHPLDVTDPRYADRGARRLYALGRLVPGTDVVRAREELRGIARELARRHPEGTVYPDGSYLGWGANELRAATVGAAGRGLGLFLGAVLFLLAIAVLNAANLLTVRGLDRRGEVGLRRALGAGRSSIALQLLLESVLLAGLGGVTGVVLAWFGVEGFLALAPPTLPRLDQVALDGRVVVASGTLTLLVGVATGLLPALGQRGVDPARVLRASNGPRATGSAGRLRMTLVAVQLGLALLLVVGASLLGRSFVELRTTDPGFELDGLVRFHLPLKRATGEPVWLAWDELLERVASVPGVETSGVTSDLPYHPPHWAPWVRRAGQPVDSLAGVSGYVITPSYLDAVGTRVLAGRGLERGDGPDAGRVALVNEAFVRAYFGPDEPVGAPLLVGEGDGERVEVVGVVEDVVQARLEDGPAPAIYVPYTQQPWPTAWVVARSGRELGPLLDDLRRAAADFDSSLPVLDLGLLRDRVRSVEAEPRFRSLVLGGFAGVALLLAAVGLYGTLSHAVGRRTREIGVRMALGADGPRILSLIVRQAGVAIAAGLAIGLLAASALAARLEGWLFGVETLDAGAYALALIVLGGIAGLAAVVPAWRAARTDVMGSLRTE